MPEDIPFLPILEELPPKEDLYFNKDDRVWSVNDSSASKIQLFQDCPRKYFYQRMLGWQLLASNEHLVFGTAWHDGLEHMIRRGLTPESIGGAYGVFLKEYRKTFTEEHDAIPSKYAKKPNDAFEALKYYQNLYQHEARERKLLHTEVAGTVSVDDRHLIHFRLDALFETKDGLLVQEHKTASQRNNNLINGWYNKMQTGVYQHVAHMMFPDREVHGVEINAIILYKAVTTAHGKQESVRIPVNKSKQMMAEWLWIVRHWLGQIEWNINELTKAKESDDILSCFPKNGESCTKYFGCEFLPYCQIWSNPLRHASEPPPGFKVKWSNLSEVEERAKKIVHLGVNE